MKRRLRWVRAFSACVGLPASFLAVPAQAYGQDDWLGRDKGLHFAVSVSLSAGGYGLSSLWLEPPWLRAVTGASLGLGAGIAKEAWDASGRGDASWRDLTWDVAGVATGVGVAWLLDWALRRGHSGQAFQAGGRF